MLCAPFDEQLFEFLKSVSQNDLPQVNCCNFDLHGGLDVAADNMSSHTGEARQELINKVCLNRTKRSKTLSQVFDALQGHLRAQLLLGFSVFYHKKSPFNLLKDCDG